MDKQNQATSYEERVVLYLKEKGLHISFAESCTGGLACASLVSVSGSSSVLNESYVTYANESKIKLLGVKKETIESFDVVSEEVAREMAQGVARASGAEIGVGVTGIAGPDGGTPEKPVGTVCFGFFINGKLDSKTVNFGSIGRNEVRQEASKYIFRALECLLNQD